MQADWPVSALSGRLHVDLPTPKHFEDVVEAMGEPKLPKDSLYGPDPDLYLDAIQSLKKDGFDHIYLHQVGPDQAGFLEFFNNSLLPKLKEKRLVEAA